MTLIHIVVMGFLMTLNTVGRMPRGQFWLFFPFGLIPPVLTIWAIDWDVSAVILNRTKIWPFALVLAASLPLISAMARRLHDVGEPGHQAMYPFMPILIVWVGYILALGGFYASFYAGIGLFLGVFLGLIAFFLLPIGYLVGFFASLFLGASVLGLLLLPSETGTNRYGPNPHGDRS